MTEKPYFMEKEEWFERDEANAEANGCNYVLTKKGKAIPKVVESYEDFQEMIEDNKKHKSDLVSYLLASSGASKDQQQEVKYLIQSLPKIKYWWPEENKVKYARVTVLFVDTTEIIKPNSRRTVYNDYYYLNGIVYKVKDDIAYIIFIRDGKPLVKQINVFAKDSVIMKGETDADKKYGDHFFNDLIVIEKKQEARAIEEAKKNKPVTNLPVIKTDEKRKGKPFAYYSYKHYEVYPGDVFYAIYRGHLLFAKSLKKGEFEAFGLLDVLNNVQKIPYDDVIDLTLDALPLNDDKTMPNASLKEDALAQDLKERMLMRFSSDLTNMEKETNLLAKFKHTYIDNKPIELKLGLFRRGSIKGKSFTIPSTVQNESSVILDGSEKDFLESYFEVEALNEELNEGEQVPAAIGSETVIFRKIKSLKDFYNLLDEGKPELLMPIDSLKAKMGHPYLYIPPKWAHGSYHCFDGTVYSLEYLFSYFDTQFYNNHGMSIVNLKQQLAPYYQRYTDIPLPYSLSRDDVLILTSKWCIQDLRDGLYYLLKPAHNNKDGSIFCLDKKWFRLFHDRVRRYGKKEVCDLTQFKFQSSKDKHYFQLFSLEEEDLKYAFGKAIDIADFKEFYSTMLVRLNPGSSESSSK